MDFIIGRLIEPFDFPFSLKLIGDSAFSLGLGWLAFQFTGESQLITIAGFANWSLIETIDISPTVVDIHSDSFSHCKRLRSLTFPSSSCRATLGGFHHCPLLTEVAIPDSVATILENSLLDAKLLVIVPFVPGSQIRVISGFTSIAITSLTLPESLEGMAQSAFLQCFALAWISFPLNSRLAVIDGFSGCPLDSLYSSFLIQFTKDGLSPTFKHSAVLSSARNWL
jgi:hypothetical protein